MTVDYSDPPFWSPTQGWTGVHDVTDYERELRRYAHALDRANALIAEAADEAKRRQGAPAERALAFLVEDGKAMRTLSTRPWLEGQFEAVAAAGWTVVRVLGSTKEEAVRLALDAYDEACRE